MAKYGDNAAEANKSRTYLSDTNQKVRNFHNPYRCYDLLERIRLERF